MRTVTHGSHFGASDKASKTDPKIVSKSDAILVTNQAPLGRPSGTPFGSKKRPKIKAKIIPIFDPIFGRFLAPKRLPKWSSKSKPGAPKSTQKSPQDPSDTHPGPQGPDQDPDGSSYRFRDRFLVDFGSQKASQNGVPRPLSNPAWPPRLDHHQAGRILAPVRPPWPPRPRPLGTLPNSSKSPRPDLKARTRPWPQGPDL